MSADESYAPLPLINDDNKANLPVSGKDCDVEAIAAGTENVSISSPTPSPSLLEVNYRSLAHVEMVLDVCPIIGADRVLKATVLGWDVVVSIDDGIKPNQLAVYLEIDSILPVSNPHFAKFLGKPLRTRKIRGCVSQGLLLPLTILPPKHHGQQYSIGEDVTRILGVEKYVSPDDYESLSCRGLVCGKGDFGVYPAYLPVTNEKRIQNHPYLLKQLVGTEVVITRKEDGTSATYSYKDGKYLICSHNKVRLTKTNDSVHYFAMDQKFGIEAILKDYNKNIAIQGEIVGPKLNGNTLRLSSYDYRVFYIWSIDDKKYFTFDQCTQFCEKYKLNQVPLLYRGSFKLEWNNMESILSYAEQQEYAPNLPAEGIVVRVNDPLKNDTSFKVISNKWLIKNNR